MFKKVLVGIAGCLFSLSAFSQNNQFSLDQSIDAKYRLLDVVMLQLQSERNRCAKIIATPLRYTLHPRWASTGGNQYTMFGVSDWDKWDQILLYADGYGDWPKRHRVVPTFAGRRQFDKNGRRQFFDSNLSGVPIEMKKTEYYDRQQIEGVRAVIDCVGKVRAAMSELVDSLRNEGFVSESELEKHIRQKFSGIKPDIFSSSVNNVGTMFTSETKTLEFLMDSENKTYHYKLSPNGTIVDSGDAKVFGDGKIEGREYWIGTTTKGQVVMLK